MKKRELTYEERAWQYLAPQLERLQEFLKDCRPDMHEPDEQDVSARVVGDKLDNAFGNDISETALVDGYQEFVVILENHAHVKLRVNLADLLALARKAVLK